MNQKYKNMLEHLEWCKQKRDLLDRYAVALESGQRKRKTKVGEGAWTDTTKQEAEEYRREAGQLTKFIDDWEF